MTPIDIVLAKFDNPRRNGSGWTARCPAHEDRMPSLSIGEGDDGRVLVTCHAGCELDAVLAAVGLDVKDLFPEPITNGKPEIIDTYDYTDEAGELLYQVCRMRPKSFRQRRPNGTGWLWRLGNVRRVPYRLRAVLDAVEAGRWVVIVEGEKDVHTLEQYGIVATTNSGGAGKWPKEFAAVPEGRQGRGHPRQRHRGEAPRRRGRRLTQGHRGKGGAIVRPCREPGGDITDWLGTTAAAAASLS